VKNTANPGFHHIVVSRRRCQHVWVGVAKAGYSASEELPIFLLLFGVPAAVALVLEWKFL
jgi:hypothetical protein